jgi:hypothetical protein
MRVGILKIAACAAVALTVGVASAEDDILYWMVDSNATVEKDGVTTSVASFFESYGAPEGSAFAARVRVTGGDIQDGKDVFLDLYIPGYGLDEGGGAWGVEFSDAGGYWGAGVPTGNQSPSGDYSAGTPEYSFIVELGNIDSSDNWTTVATSAAATYSSLGNYIHQTFDINPGQIAVWAPTAFSVPEPSSGLLTLIGFSFLALRRKRKEA